MSFQSTNIVMWSIAFIAAWECIFGISHLRRGHKVFFPKWSTFEAAVYEMLTRVAWSFAMGWVVIACVKGHGGLVNKFLSWGVFQPLAKVSYMVYLTHLTVMDYLYGYSRTYEAESSHFYQVTMAMDDFSTLIKMSFFCLQFYSFVGVTSVTFAISLVFVLLFEAPFSNLQKLLLGGRFIAIKI